jgi:hypothetical protein
MNREDHDPITCERDPPIQQIRQTRRQSSIPTTRSDLLGRAAWRLRLRKIRSSSRGISGAQLHDGSGRVQMQTGGLQNQAGFCTAFVPVTEPTHLSCPPAAFFLCLSVLQETVQNLGVCRPLVRVEHRESGRIKGRDDLRASFSPQSLDGLMRTRGPVGEFRLYCPLDETATR